jgi:hypothetical protein
MGPTCQSKITLQKTAPRRVMQLEQTIQATFVLYMFELTSFIELYLPFGKSVSRLLPRSSTEEQLVAVATGYRLFVARPRSPEVRETTWPHCKLEEIRCGLRQSNFPILDVRPWRAPRRCRRTRRHEGGREAFQLTRSLPTALREIVSVLPLKMMGFTIRFVSSTN